MADYTVGTSGTYASIQAAVDQLKADAGGIAFTEAHSISVIDYGRYNKFRILSGELAPTVTYGLTITSTTSSYPMIVSTDPTNEDDGAFIDSPYTTIENFHVRGFYRGVVFQSSAATATARNLYLTRMQNTGLVVWEAEDFFGYNIVARANPIGIAGVRAKNFALFFSSVLTKENANVRRLRALGKDPGLACVWVSAPLDTGGGATDTGTTTLRHNNLIAEAGRCISVPKKSVDALDSDYNNFFCPHGQQCEIVEGSSRMPYGIPAWRVVTQGDENSIAEDPIIYNAVEGKRGDTILNADLRPKPYSPVVGRGEDMSLASYLPHIIKIDMEDDILGTTRATNGTLGAYETDAASWNYWDYIFPTTGETDPHGADISRVTEAAKAHYSDNVTPWFPQLRTGYFWAKDHLYYLYSEKEFSYLDDMRYFTMSMGERLEPDTVNVTLDGAPASGEEYWELAGTSFYFKQGDLDITDGSEELVVSGEYLTWNTGDHDFDTGEYAFTGELSTGTVNYIFDVTPVAGLPIVVTDATITDSTATGDLPYGFEISYNDTFKKTEITFQSGKLPTDKADVTVEWEGSDSGVYEIADLTVNPMTNPETTGFLSIKNLPGTQFWGSGETLDDDWVVGRSSTMPWAKITGKPKWQNIIREDAAPLPELAAHTHPVADPTQIQAMPKPLIILQGATGEEVTFRVFDDAGNSHAYEWAAFNLTSEATGEATGEFPGYVAKRHYGIYTDLGQAIAAETDPAGAITLRVLPVARQDAEMANPTVVVDGGDKYIITKYDINMMNYGNPTILDENLDLVTLTGDLVTGEIAGAVGSGYYTYDLTSYPKRFSIKAWNSGVRQNEVFHDKPQDGEFYTDYNNKQVMSTSSGPLIIHLTPVLSWVTPDYQRRLYVDSAMSLPANMIVNYDAKVYLRASVTGELSTPTYDLDVIYRNPYATGEL